MDLMVFNFVFKALPEGVGSIAVGRYFAVALRLGQGCTKKTKAGQCWCKACSFAMTVLILRFWRFLV